jgi:hypothetical protein
MWRFGIGGVCAIIPKIPCIFPASREFRLRRRKEWVDVGIFDTVTAAARRIRELEGYPRAGVFLEFYATRLDYD